jgi:hypothetical protein
MEVEIMLYQLEQTTLLTFGTLEKLRYLFFRIKVSLQILRQLLNLESQNVLMSCDMMAND